MLVVDGEPKALMFAVRFISVAPENRQEGATLSRPLLVS